MPRPKNWIGNDNDWTHPLMRQLRLEIDAGTCQVDNTHGVKGPHSCGGLTTYTLSDGTVIDADSFPVEEGGFFTEYKIISKGGDA